MNRQTLQTARAAGDTVIDNHDLILRSGGAERIHLYGNTGVIAALDASGREVLHFLPGNAVLTVGAQGSEGDIVVRDDQGRAVFSFNGGSAILTIGSTGNEGDLNVVDDQGRQVLAFNGGSAILTIGATGNEGDINVVDGNGRNSVRVDGGSATVFVGAEGNEGDIRLFDDAGNETIHLDGQSGDIRLIGADLAEDFTVPGPIEPGTVLAAIGQDEVEPTTSAMDARVVGVASGAGGYRPALRLGQKPGVRGRVPVALTGRVFCKADAGYGAIGVGDLLTSSPTRGHAMRVTDPFAAAGAVIGKALGGLAEGTGLIPILVTLR